MMTRKTAKIIVLLGVVILASGCAGGDYVPNQPSALELAARETAEAQATRDTLRGMARATSDALALSQQATTQALDAQATAQALTVQATAVQATADAQNANAMATRGAANANATATIESQAVTAQAANANATATATREAATATIQAQLDSARATAVQATAASVARLEERERITQPLRTFGPWLLILLAVVLLVILAFHGWRLFEDRARLVRRDPDEGEPIMILSRERIALPMRQFGSYQDMTQGQESAPLLAPTVEAQAGATMRQQTSNAIQARQVGRVAQAKSKHGQSVVIPPSRAARREYHDPQLPPIRVRDAQGLRPLIEDVRRQIEEGTIEGELLC